MYENKKKNEEELESEGGGRVILSRYICKLQYNVAYIYNKTKVAKEKINISQSTIVFYGGWNSHYYFLTKLDLSIFYPSISLQFIKENYIHTVTIRSMCIIMVRIKFMIIFYFF